MSEDKNLDFGKAFAREGHEHGVRAYFFEC